MRQGPPKTVLVALHEETLGGATRSVVRLAPLLEERGWRLVFWASCPSPLFDQLAGLGLEVHGGRRPLGYSLDALRLPPGPRRRLAGLPSYLARFRRALRELSPTVLHANSVFTLAEALVARATGVPTVLHVHEMMRKGWKYFLATRIARAALSEVVAVSKASAAAMAVSGWAPQIVHEGAPIPAAQLSLRPQPKPFRVGTVGVISRRKGTDLFVEAAQRLPVADGEYEFHLIGAPTDELERDWAVEVIDRAVNAGVLYRESADVSQALRSWDAFVLPSRSDPFPIVMLEAMAAGLPAIGARRDGLEEQLEGGAGLLVEPESATALAEGIRELAQLSIEERTALAARGRQRACTFSLERQAEGLAAAYSTALKNHPEMRS